MIYSHVSPSFNCLTTYSKSIQNMSSSLKVLAIGDPHFMKDNEDVTDKLLSETLDLIDDRSIDMVVILGDLMHDHGVARMNLFNRSCAFLEAIGKRMGKDNSFLLIGNHDRINNKVSSGDEHFFKHVKDKPNMPTIIDEVTLISKGDYNFLMCQYIEPGLLMNHIEPCLKSSEVELESITTCFMHQEIKGCTIGGRESTVGDEWSEEYPLVISGHIHEWQMHQSNVNYVGTPMQVTFGCTDRKTVTVLTYDSDGRRDNERIPLDMPKKISRKMNCKDFSEFMIPRNAWIRFKIVDTAKKITTMKSSSKFKEVSMYPKVKFVFSDVKEDVDVNMIAANEVSVINSPFIARMNAAVDDELRVIYNEIVDAA